MALKLDIPKASDHVERNFLDAVMQQMSLCDKCRAWTMKCITSVTYSVLINVIPSKKKYSQRGIRQRDLIFPYLYLICTEGLSQMISHGFTASTSGPVISHIFLANDSLSSAKQQQRNITTCWLSSKDTERCLEKQ